MPAPKSSTNGGSLILSRGTQDILSQEIPRLLQNTVVHVRVHKSTPQVPIPNHIHLVHTLHLCCSKIHFNVCVDECVFVYGKSPAKWQDAGYRPQRSRIHRTRHELRTAGNTTAFTIHSLPGSSVSPLLFGLANKILYAFLISLIRATCNTYLILFNSITLVMFCEENKVGKNSLCLFVQPSAYSFFLGSNFLLSTLFSNSLSLCKISLSHGDKYENGCLVDVALCSLVDTDRCSRGAYCLNRRPEAGGSKLLWNVGQCLPVYMAHQRRRQPFSYLLPRNLQISQDNFGRNRRPEFYRPRN
jgi:hypothetical protein